MRSFMGCVAMLAVASMCSMSGEGAESGGGDVPVDPNPPGSGVAPNPTTGEDAADALNNSGNDAGSDDDS